MSDTFDPIGNPDNTPIEVWRKSRLERFGKLLLDYPDFKTVLDATFGSGVPSLYVLGGAVMGALNGIKEDTGRECLPISLFFNDLDCFVETKLELTLLVGGLRGSNVSVEYNGEDTNCRPVARVFEKINVVAAEPFADTVKDIAQRTGANIDSTDDNVSLMLKHTPLERASQVALRFYREGEGVSLEIIDPARILCDAADPLTRANPTTVTGLDQIRALNKADAGSIRDKELEKALFKRAVTEVSIRPLNRLSKLLPSFVSLGRWGDYLEGRVTNILGEFIRRAINYELSVSEKNYLRKRSATQLCRAIGTKDPIVMKELFFYPFELLFSPTLTLNRGFALYGEYEPYKLMLLPNPDSNRGFAVHSESQPHELMRSHIPPERIGPQPVTGCNVFSELGSPASITEYFALLAGIAQLDEDKISQVAGELSQTWPDLSQMTWGPAVIQSDGGWKSVDPIDTGFDREAFIRWATDISRIVISSDPAFLYGDVPLVNVIRAIRTSRFWAEAHPRD